MKRALLLLLVVGCVDGVSVLGPTEGDVLQGGRLLSCGSGHSCVIAGGNLQCWGGNGDYELAQPESRPSTTPVGIGGEWTDVAAGYRYTCGISDSVVHCWGSGADGRLGDGRTASSADVSPVALPAPAVQIATHFDHSCVITDDGALHCWGNNEEGQLTVAGSTSEPRPVAVAPELRFQTVGLGQGHTCAIQTTGALLCWGRNTTGQLGQGEGAPVRITTPSAVGTDTDWDALAVGQDQALAIRLDGTLWAFGLDGNDLEVGSLGLPGIGVYTTPVQVGDADNWRLVATDTFHSCGIRGAGELWCWGQNADGQLALADREPRDLPTRVGTRDDWEAVAVSRFHTCALRRDGTVWCAGANWNGQLGQGDFEARDELTPVLAAPID